MTQRRKIGVFASVMALGGSSLIFSMPQDEALEPRPLETQHAECSLFTPRGARFRLNPRVQYSASAMTEAVVGKSSASPRTVVPGGSRTDIFQQLDQLGIIDSNLFRAMQEAGVSPADKTDDLTFARRVSLDLTGRVPSYQRLMQFYNDPAADKRSRYVDELLASSEWVDKWTMFFGDLFKNTANNAQVQRYEEGRNAFYNYIKASLQASKRYNTMVSEMISRSGTNSWDQGELNWNVGGIVQGGPRTGQDIFDQQAVNVVETFLGISHFDCIMCHDGRRHLDTMSLWGKYAVRLDTWGASAFFAKTPVTRVVVSTQPTRYYYTVQDTGRTDYALNTTTGNRPTRAPVGSVATVAPQYPFDDRPKPASGEPYRTALARFVTNDFQFARATVNYFWKEYFGRGLVEPVDQFDIDRLDPDNPPPEPWTLQPSNPRLLNALARDFIDGGYDLKALTRWIVNSEAYQLSSRYNGEWKAEWEPLFARKFVRRLWAEEVTDTISQVSNIPQTYAAGSLGTLNWAMQLPETQNLPGGRAAIGSFLNSFFRGNRVDDFRRQDGSIAQTLNLMNDTFIHTRTRASGTGATASLARRLLTTYATSANNDALVQEMYLTVLSRMPTDAELASSRTRLNEGTTATLRQQAVEDLLWVLYNKVDMVFNY